MAIGAILGLIGSALNAQSNTGDKESKQTDKVATSEAVNGGYEPPEINQADVKPVESDNEENSEKMDWNSIGQLADDLESAYGRKSSPLVPSNNIAGR